MASLKITKNTVFRLMLFGVGLISLIPVRIVGLMYLSEVLALLFFPFLVFSLRTLPKKILVIFLLLFLWLIGSTLSGFYNNVGHINTLKGAGTVLLFFPGVLLALWLLKYDYKNVVYYLLGKAVSAYLSFFIFPTQHISSQISQKGQAVFFQEMLPFLLIPTIVWLLTILWIKKKYFLSFFILLISGIGALALGSRSLFILLLIAMLFLFYGHVKKIYKLDNYVFSLRRIVSTFLYFIPAVVLLIYIYIHMASTGALGENAKNKYYNQVQSNVGLLVGRSDLFQGLLAISERPIIGYGPYAHDYTDIRLRTSEMLGDDRSATYFSNLEISETMVPRHSYILGAWVFSGILSLPLWLYILYLTLSFIRKNLYFDYNFVAYFAVSNILFLWNIFFSPLQGRTDISILLVMMVLLLQKYKRSLCK